MTEIFEMVVTQAAFKVGARIDTRRSMALEVDEISGLFTILCMKEVVETNLKKCRQRRIRGYMSADSSVLLVLAMHHCQRVPADESFHATLDMAIARIRYLIMLRDGIEVGGANLAGSVDACLARSLPQRTHQLRCLLRAFV